MSRALRFVVLEVSIRRPRPSLRPGRRLGPPEVWNLAVSSHGAQACRLSSWLSKATSIACYWRSHQQLFPGVQACRLPGVKPLKTLKTPQNLFLAFLSFKAPSKVPSISFLLAFKPAVARLQTFQNLPKPPKSFKNPSKTFQRLIWHPWPCRPTH